MRKIPTLFKREFKDHKIVNVLPEYTNDLCVKALMFGKPTIKWDGSCCCIIGGALYKRYDAKKGKPVPEGAIQCQKEPDPVTGHLPCWVRVDDKNPADKWFVEAFEASNNKFNMVNHGMALPDGTYEAIGPHFQGNPYELPFDILIKHGLHECQDFTLTVPETPQAALEYVYNYLVAHDKSEGIVFWSDNEPVCKIKRTDFGLEWPVKNKEDK